jgi:hypothetical protein
MISEIFPKYMMQGQLSWVLVPISLYIIFYKKELIKYISYIFICIAIIGTYDTYLIYSKYFAEVNLLYILLSYIFHLALLFPLINIQEYLQINYINYLLGIVGLIIIKFLPYWPYLVSRESMTYISIIIYFILTVISLFYTSNNKILN